MVGREQANQLFLGISAPRKWCVSQHAEAIGVSENSFPPKTRQAILQGGRKNQLNGVIAHIKILINGLLGGWNFHPTYRGPINLFCIGFAVKIGWPERTKEYRSHDITPNFETRTLLGQSVKTLISSMYGSLPKTNIAPENRSFQKESSLPTITF